MVTGLEIKALTRILVEQYGKNIEKKDAMWIFNEELSHRWDEIHKGEPTDLIEDLMAHIENGWYVCPHCKKKLFPVERDTKVQNLPYKCKACKHEFKVNI